MTDQTPPGREYVAVRFGTPGSRTYTYHNDSIPVFPGDRVQVPSRKGGWTETTVDHITREVPPFPTKEIGAILSRAKKPEADLGDLLDEPAKP